MSLPKRLDALFGKESNGKTWWNKIGVAFATKSENGYRVTLDAIPAPVDGAYTFNLFIPNENNSGNSNSGNSSGYSGGSGNSRPGANRTPEVSDDDIPF